MTSFNGHSLATSRAQSITLSFILGVGVALAGCASDDELESFDDTDWVTLSDGEAIELAETANVLEQSDVETMVARDDDGGLRTTSSAGYWLENEGEVAFDLMVSCSATCPGGCRAFGVGAMLARFVSFRFVSFRFVSFRFVSPGLKPVAAQHSRLAAFHPEDANGRKHSGEQPVD